MAPLTRSRSRRAAALASDSPSTTTTTVERGEDGDDELHRKKDRAGMSMKRDSAATHTTSDEDDEESSMSLRNKRSRRSRDTRATRKRRRVSVRTRSFIEEDDTDEDYDDDEYEYASSINSVINCKKKRSVGSAFVAYDAEERKYYSGLDVNARSRVDELETQVRNACSPTTAQQQRPFRFRILESGWDASTKSLALLRADSLKRSLPCSSEHQKLREWLEALLRIPAGVLTPLPIERVNDAECSSGVAAFLRRTALVLDREVYGHEAVKKEMLMTLAKWASNVDAPGVVIGIEGPAGVGKTTIVKHGLCRALGWPCAFVPLGGANDAAFLDGHSYTYEGSTWGRIIGCLMETRCMNPVFVFDELDKVADNVRGVEIYNVLMHITDASANDRFCDKYFQNIPIDLSRCIMVFTYNDEAKISPILRDRMIRLRVKDYSVSDKIHILQHHVLPQLRTAYALNDAQLIIDQEALRHVVSLHSEVPGLRDCKRTLEAVLGHVNVWRLMCSEEEGAGQDNGARALEDVMMLKGMRRIERGDEEKRGVYRVTPDLIDRCSKHVRDFTSSERALRNIGHMYC